MKELLSALNADFESGRRDRGLTHRSLAVAMFKSPSSSWPYQLLSGEIGFNLTLLPIWINLTGGEHLLRHLAGITGHVVLPRPAAGPRECAAEVTSRFAKFLSSTALAEQGHVSITEAETVEQEAAKAVEAILAEVERIRDRANRGGRVTTLAEAARRSA